MQGRGQAPFLHRLAVPIVGAPLAGGASTPALAAAVSEAGGLGFVASAYKSPDAMAEDVAATRALTAAPIGVNVFALTPTEAPPEALEAYRRRVAAYGVEPGAPRSDDDAFAAKVERLIADPVAVVSFTFGCPAAEVVDRLHAAGSQVWITIADPAETAAAEAAGADALIVQGVEAGGHRGGFGDEAPGDYGLLALLALTRAATDLPLVATGGIATGRGIAAVLAAGASAAALGTALMRCPEAGTAPVHRDALSRPGRTAVTRAFTGRSARGIVNAFMRDQEAHAPHAYPAVNHITAPLRARARAAGDLETLHLWAGQAHELAREVPAAQLVRELHAEARAAAAEAAARLGR